MLNQWVWMVLATACAGIGSVWLAALFNRLFFVRHLQLLLSFAAGALLSTALLLLLPEAFDSDWDVHILFTVLLTALVVFFLLDKAQIWHHAHEHSTEPLHAHSHKTPMHEQGTAAHDHSHGSTWILLLGDSLHCFSDGILIATAMLVDIQLGWIAAFAVLVHEIPHHMGDLAVLQQQNTKASASAIKKVSLAGAVTIIGGVIGLSLATVIQPYLPLFVVAASASFIYVALADLIPQLHKQTRRSVALVQSLGLVLGIVSVHVMAHLIAH